MTNKRYVEQIDEFIYDKNNTSMPMTLGTLVLVCFCVLLFIIITFVKIDLFQYVPIFDENNNLHFVMQKFPYIMQIPLIVLFASILGARFSLLSVLIYILMGLFIWPIFAFGGGIGYLKTYFFGYILGYMPCVILIGFILRKFKDFRGFLLGGVLGPLSIYVTAFLYSTILLLFKQVDFSTIYFEIILAPLGKIPYDVLFSFIVILAAKPLRYFFWLMCGNTKKSKKKKHSK